jgi:cytochrome c oxidase subunit 2
MRALAATSGFASMLAAAGALAATQMNMSPGVTPISRAVYDLHATIMWIILVIFIGVFGVMFYSVFKFRRSKGAQAAQFHENTTVEVVWTVIPFLILIFMAWPATSTLLDMRDTSAPDMTLKVTGSQWKWTYDYIEDGFAYTSNLTTPLAQITNAEPKGEHYLLEVDNPMVVPVGKRVRVLITAADVLHAWWVPELGVKQDAIPGFVRDAWFLAERVGTYRGQCAELCGKDHGFMPIVVEVKSQEDYAKWVADRKRAAMAAADDPNKQWEDKDLVARGEKVYLANCAACHQPTGKGAPPAFPALDGSKVVNGPRQGQIELVLNGKQGTAMAPFKHLSDVEVAAVISYTRSSWANKAGAVQPAEVRTVRGGGTPAS